VEYGYLKRLIDKKKKEFCINCRISTKSIMNCTHRGTTSSPYQSDEEENYDADAVEGLLGIAHTDLISMDRLKEVEDEEGIHEDNNEYGWGSV
jgi:hypothetical protein